MTIIHWPLDERPREKLLNKGAKSLSDAELVAIFLRTGRHGKTAVDIARELLNDFGGLRALLEGTVHSICQKPGVGKAKYAMLSAALELGRRHQEAGLKVGEKLSHSQMTKRFLAARLSHYSHEVFACLYLDNHNRMIAFKELFHGTLTEANVYPREVVKSGLLHNAAKVILAHNHPSGNPIPSQSDQEMTQLLKQALALVDIKLIDHIIIGGDHTSFAETGLL